MSSFRRTYELVPNPPPAMSWDEYETIIMDRWNILIQSEGRTDERKLQAFLEAHPCMLPTYGHHGPFPAAVIAQPPLTGLFNRIPDFMWITSTSDSVYAELIEIEIPAKRWFLENGEVSADLRHAMGQLLDWQKWFERHGQTFFYELFRVPTGLREFRRFSLRYTLIYGSRSEFIANPDWQDTKARLEANTKDARFMTFDRLRPSFDLREMMTVRLQGNHFRAISCPPTLTLGPTWATERLLIKDKKQVIMGNADVSPERRDFLAGRVDYWDEWSRTSNRGIRSTGDRE